MPSRERLYRIGRAAALLEVRTSVLRFWETEFPELSPTRLPSGHRAYTDRDLQLLKKIKTLLHGKGMTIEGARQALAKSGAGGLSQEEKESRRLELEERRRALIQRRRERVQARRAEALQAEKALQTAQTAQAAQAAQAEKALSEDEGSFLRELDQALAELAGQLNQGASP